MVAEARGWQVTLHPHAAGSELVVSWARTSRPGFSDPLPQTRLHLVKVLQPLHIAPLAGGQELKYTRLHGMVHLQTIS